MGGGTPDGEADRRVSQSPAQTPLAREPDFASALSGLRAKHAAFVVAYLATGNATEAYRRAGYSTRYASRLAYKLVHRRDIAAAIEACRAIKAREAEYTFDKASAELDDAASFARATKNAMAFVRARELKAKLWGHLVERQDIRAQGDVIFRFPERHSEPAAIADQSGEPS